MFADILKALGHSNTFLIKLLSSSFFVALKSSKTLGVQGNRKRPTCNAPQRLHESPGNSTEGEKVKLKGTIPVQHSKTIPVFQYNVLGMRRFQKWRSFWDFPQVRVPRTGAEWVGVQLHTMRDPDCNKPIFTVIEVSIRTPILQDVTIG